MLGFLPAFYSCNLTSSSLLPLKLEQLQNINHMINIWESAFVVFQPHCQTSCLESCMKLFNLKPLSDPGSQPTGKASTWLSLQQPFKGMHKHFMFSHCIFFQGLLIGAYAFICNILKHKDASSLQKLFIVMHTTLISIIAQFQLFVFVLDVVAHPADLRDYSGSGLPVTLGGVWSISLI